MSNPVGLGKGIGIPVKLLHEAEGHTVTVRALATNPRDVRTPSPLARAPRAVSRIEMRAPENLVQAAAVPTRPPIAPADPSPLPPHATDRAEDGRDVPGNAAGERGQLELPAAGHHAHGSGRSGQSAGARVHPREQDSIPGHPGHAQERAHVQEDRSPLGRARGTGRSWRGGRRTGGSGRAVMRPIARVFVAALGRRVDQSIVNERLQPRTRTRRLSLRSCITSSTRERVDRSRVTPLTSRTAATPPRTSAKSPPGSSS